jgi:hypothetical protein
LLHSRAPGSQCTSGSGMSPWPYQPAILPNFPALRCVFRRELPAKPKSPSGNGWTRGMLHSCQQTFIRLAKASNVSGWGFFFVPPGSHGVSSAKPIISIWTRTSSLWPRQEWPETPTGRYWPMSTRLVCLVPAKHKVRAVMGRENPERSSPTALCRVEDACAREV